MTQVATFTPIPLGLDDFVQGGLVSNVPVEILAIQFRGWDYNGKIDSMVLAVWQQLALLDENLKRTNDPALEQYWSCGPDLQKTGISISTDGYMIAPGASQSQLTLSSNFHEFLESLNKPKMGGPPMPRDWLKGGSIKPLLGTKYHLVRVAQQVREGLPQRQRERDFDPTVAVAVRIYVGPWAPNVKATKAVKGEVAAATTAAASPATTASTPAAPVEQAVNGAPAPDTTAPPATDEITQTAINTVKQALAEQTMFASVNELKVECFRKHAKTKQETRTAIMKLVMDPAWLKSVGFNIADDGIVSM